MRVHILLLLCGALALHCGGQVRSSATDDGGPRSSSGGDLGDDSAAVTGEPDGSVRAGGVAKDSGSSVGVRSEAGSGGGVPAMDAGVTLPPGCTVSPTTCDLCLGGHCCGQVVECKRDPACRPALACVIACERSGESGASCWSGSCASSPNASATALFACGEQYCAAECAP